MYVSSFHLSCGCVYVRGTVEMNIIQANMILFAQLLLLLGHALCGDVITLYNANDLIQRPAK